MTDIKHDIGALYAFDVYSDGHTEIYSGGQLPRLGDSVAYRWVHLDLEHEGAFNWIKAQTDETVAEALTMDDTRPRHTRHENASLLNLRGVNLNPASDPEDMVSIRLWANERMIISVRRRKLMAVVAMREAIEAGHAPKSVGEFLTQLSEGMTERMTPVIDGLVDELDALEEQSLEQSTGLRSQLAELRRTVIALRRYIGPQREALSRLAADGGNLIGEDEKSDLRENVDRITRLMEEMDAIRERCGVMNDQLADARAEEMNRNMMVLSVVAAIFLPLGFLTGLLGVNVGGIPGADNAYAFLLLCIFMVLLGGGITLLFKKLKWL
ncbi:MAG: zinc transporter ZntB [Pseudomonadota bacterium]